MNRSSPAHGRITPHQGQELFTYARKLRSRKVSSVQCPEQGLGKKKKGHKTVSRIPPLVGATTMGFVRIARSQRPPPDWLRIYLLWKWSTYVRKLKFTGYQSRVSWLYFWPLHQIMQLHDTSLDFSDPETQQIDCPGIGDNQQ